MIFDEWLRSKPVIGMLHLLPLPGAPNARLDLDEVLQRCLVDAEALVEGGCHGLMVENFGDTPFFPGRVPASVVACLTRAAVAIKQRFKTVPLGVNVLRNDGMSAIAIALASGAEFVRINVLTGARVTDQGLIQGIAHDLMRERTILGAQHLRVFADVDVKHSAPLSSRMLADEVKDTVLRGLADAVIVSGSGTGEAVPEDKLSAVKKAAQGVPVFVGSGVNESNMPKLAKHADGFIVGTTFKAGGVATREVDPARVRGFLQVYTAKVTNHK